MFDNTSTLREIYSLKLFAFVAALFFLPLVSFASTLSLAPATGVYTIGNTFSVSVVVNTKGAPINAADATITFNPKELNVVGISKGSTFNLWTTEPTYSNSAGTVSFSGGTPSGYTGSNGTIMTITFKAVGAATARASITNGSVLAADGRGTNVLTAMNGGTYTISAAAAQPTAEVVVEYVAPANTPAAPKITSTTHPLDTWSKEKTAKLSWTLPSDVTAVRTLLDNSASAVPTKVYDTPISSITLDNLDEGVSYFHLQFQNEEGWGKVAHYKLAVDSQISEDFKLSLKEGANLANPEQILIVTAPENSGAPLAKYKVQLNGSEPFEVADSEGKGEIKLPALTPGYQTVVVEVFDAAGNSKIVSYSFTIEAFEAPRFTDFPTTLNPGVIPVVKGQTRPRSSVAVLVSKSGTEDRTYNTQSNEAGEFSFIPDGALDNGVYVIKAVATDEFGAVSAPSEEIRIAVQPTGIIKIGSLMVSYLSVIIPLIALLILTGLGIIFIFGRMKHLKTVIGRETSEVAVSLDEQFAKIAAVLDEEEDKIKSSRKTKKLTVAEAEFIAKLRATIGVAETEVEKEVQDVSAIVSKGK